MKPSRPSRKDRRSKRIPEEHRLLLSILCHSSLVTAFQISKYTTASHPWPVCVTETWW